MGLVAIMGSCQSTVHKQMGFDSEPILVEGIEGAEYFASLVEIPEVACVRLARTIDEREMD
jgi:hypothetical protein